MEVHGRHVVRPGDDVWQWCVFVVHRGHTGYIGDSDRGRTQTHTGGRPCIRFIMVMITGCVYDGARTDAEYRAAGMTPHDKDLTSSDLVSIRPSLPNRGVFLEHNMEKRVGRIVSASIDRDATGVARKLNVMIELDTNSPSLAASGVGMKQVMASQRYLSLRHMLYTNDTNGKTASRLGSVGIEVSLVQRPGRNFTAHRMASEADIKALSVCASSDMGGINPTDVATVSVTNDAFEYSVSSPGVQQGKQRYKTSRFVSCTTRHPPHTLTHTSPPDVFFRARRHRGGRHRGCRRCCTGRREEGRRDEDGSW